MRRPVVGSIVGVALAVGIGALLLPVRPHLSSATAALIFVLPVVAGVILGGFMAGSASVVAGFLVYDFGFIPPYGTLTVETHQEWVTLVVYVIVMLLVARVVANLDSARSAALDRTAEARRLFELSELLVEDRSVDELLRTIVQTVMSVFDVPGVTLLVPTEGRLEVAASSGQELSAADLHQLEPRSGVPVGLGTAPGGVGGVQTVALTAAGRPVGILAMGAMPASKTDAALLRTFANHAALALERAQLREQAMRSELLEEVDRLRHAMVGAVSHDLRTPLATMKVASSTLLHPAVPLSAAVTDELHELIDLETDRLTRLVNSLLDMTRIDAGVLEVRRTPKSVAELVEDSVDALRSMLGDRPVNVSVEIGLPDVDVDPPLIEQALANLLGNANRHAPAGSPIDVSAKLGDGDVAVSVSDAGPGVPSNEREAVFDRYVRFDTGGRAGLGLTIAKTFVEAHGGRIWVEDVSGGGARFVFTLPVSAVVGAAQ